MSEELNQLLEQSQKVYNENFPNKAWFGRCLFLSWYCDVGTCKFCFRSTTKSKIRHAQVARRSIESLVVEALLCKNLGWRIEFLTGGYKIYPVEDLVEIARIISEVFGEKIWLNLGVISPEDLEKFKPYVKGIVASIEVIEPKLHKEICPDKNIIDYEVMLDGAKDFKKSMTIVLGLGEKKEDIPLLYDFIEKHNLDRITFYALKPIKGTGYEKGPDTEHYAYWVAKTRIKFPKLQIICGTFVNRVEEISTILKAGANAITKFPATKKFNSPEAIEFEKQVNDADRDFTSTLTKIPEGVNWQEQIDNLSITDESKELVKNKLFDYLEKMKKNKAPEEIN